MEFSKYDRRVVPVLDHVQVMMPEGGEDDARRFYAGILGLTEVEKPEPMQANGGVWFADLTEARTLDGRSRRGGGPGRVVYGSGHVRSGS